MASRFIMSDQDPFEFAIEDLAQMKISWIRNSGVLFEVTRLLASYGLRLEVSPDEIEFS